MDPDVTGPDDADQPISGGMTSGLSAFPRNERAAAESARADRADRSRSGRRVVYWVVGSVVGLGLSLGAAATSGKDKQESTPVVGECAKPAGTDDVEKVDCDDSEAVYEIVGRSEKKVDPEEFCAAFGRASEYFVYSAGSRSIDVSNLVLCLAPLDRSAPEKQST